MGAKDSRFEVKIPMELQIGPDYVIDLPQGFKAEIYKQQEEHYIIFVKDCDGLPAEADHMMNPTGMDTKLGLRLCLEEWARSIERGDLSPESQPQAPGLTEVPQSMGHKHHN